MLSNANEFVFTAEVNPPDLPGMDHLMLEGTWDHVMVTDNVFGKIRVSPYAYAARITHDVPTVKPTVVVSTRDRNILAIESEARGALGNGVNSFLVVVGDSMPQVDHLANHYEIAEHLHELRGRVPMPFEVGMPTRFRRWQYRQRKELGVQFFVAGPVLDVATVEASLDSLDRQPGDPPVHVMVMPPFSAKWVAHAESMGAVAVSDGFKERLDEIPEDGRRAYAWEHTLEISSKLKALEAGGAVIVGLSFSTLIDEAVMSFRRPWQESANAR